MDGSRTRRLVCDRAEYPAGETVGLTHQLMDYGFKAFLPRKGDKYGLRAFFIGLPIEIGLGSLSSLVVRLVQFL
jgi:hypothetical protein